MKYARLVDGRVLDLVNTDDYDPRPEWGQTDRDLLDRIFEAVGGYAAFTMIPNYVKPYEEVTKDGFETDAAHEARLQQEAAAQVYAESLDDPPMHIQV